MSGWVLVSGNQDKLDQITQRFKTVFSAHRELDFLLKYHHLNSELTLVTWGWGESSSSDIDYYIGHDNEPIVILEGYLLEVQGLDSELNNSRCENYAELIGRNWRSCGWDILKKMNGSFSLTVINPVRKKITLFTDRIASRPIWWCRDSCNYYIGNYPAALATLTDSAPKINPAGLWSLFAASRQTGREGLYSGIKRLHGGEAATIQPDQTLELKSWFDLTYKPETGRTPDQWARELKSVLTDAARAHTSVMQAPYLFLSGGLDSRVAAGALETSHFEAGLHSVTMTSSGNNMNAKVAYKVAQHVGSKHQLIERSPYWYIDNFSTAALLSGGNYNVRHAHYIVPMHIILQKNSKASFLLGDMLENFNKHYFKSHSGNVWEFIPENVPDIFPKLYSYVHRDFSALSRHFNSNIAVRIEDSWREELVTLCQKVRRVSDDDRDCYDALFRWYNCGFCPTYLMFECMRPFGRERNIMFDNRLLELLLRIPASLRGKGVMHRKTLWELNKRLALTTNSNYWLPAIVPDDISKRISVVRPYLGRLRRKILRKSTGGGAVIKTEGSWHMLSEWYQKDKRHREYIESYLKDERVFPSEIFDRKEILKTWRNFLTDPTKKKHIFDIDMLLSFGILNKQLPFSDIA